MVGILDRIRGKGKPVETYVLKRQTETGGMAKIADISPEQADLEVFSKSDLFASLAKGIYVLHAYSKGKSGFRVVWGPVAFGESQEAAEEMAEEKRKRRELSPEEAIQKALAPIEQIKKVADIYDKYFGRTALMENLKAARADFQELGSLFGGATKTSEDVLYEGKLPVWMHPKAIVGTIDMALDTIERRGKTWGLIASEQQGGGQELIKLPAKPAPKVETGKVDVSSTESTDAGVSVQPTFQQESADETNGEDEDVTEHDREAD
jgi:hypothetical protein